MKDVIPACKGIAALLIDIESSTPCNQELKVAVIFIINTLQVVLPVFVFMDFIKDYQRCGKVFSLQSFEKSGTCNKPAPVFGAVAVKIKTVCKPSSYQHGKGCLSRLARAGKKDHVFLCRKFFPDIQEH